MTQEQLLKTAIDLGPIILSILGAILTVAFAAFAAIAKAAWKVHNRRMATMSETIAHLARAVGKYEENNHKDHAKVWDSIMGLRAELQLSTQRSDHIKAGLLKLEGALAIQVSRVDTYVERMGRVDSKLDRIFEYIDAPKRATDV